MCIRDSKTPLQLSKNIIPKHRPNPGRHASQSVTRASPPPTAACPSHPNPNSDLYVGLLVPTRPRSRSWPHGVTSQRIPQDERTPAARSAQRGFFHVRGRAGKLPLSLIHIYFERRSFDAAIDVSPYKGSELLEVLRELGVPTVLCGQLEGHPYRDVFSTIPADGRLPDEASGHPAEDHQ